jgi:hypothetical protein
VPTSALPGLAGPGLALSGLALSGLALPGSAPGVVFAELAAGVPDSSAGSAVSTVS